MRTTDTRGRTVPEDQRTHIDRINDWEGSDSYVEGVGSGRDPAPYEPRTPLLPYMLLTKATDRHGLLRKAGQIVELHASEVADHHRQLPNVDYTPHRPTARAEALVAEVKDEFPKEFKAEVKSEVSDDSQRRRKKEADD